MYSQVPNRQLVVEGDDLALLYDDQSIAEQNSINIALSTLSDVRFAELYAMIAPTNSDELVFRKLVIDMLLCTDISSPERLQIGKSKWNSAFETSLKSPTSTTIPSRRKSMKIFPQNANQLVL